MHEKDHDHEPRKATGVTGHPLPASDEARHSEIPEHLEEEKGLGDNGEDALQPSRSVVNPDGEPYPATDLGR